MCYREEAIECVKDHVLQIHKQIITAHSQVDEEQTHLYETLWNMHADALFF